MKQRQSVFWATHCRGLLLLLLLTLGHGAWAYDGFLHDAENYKAEIVDYDKVKFILPTQLWRPFYSEGVVDGNVTLTVENGARETIFEWTSGSDYNGMTKNGISGQLSCTTKKDGVWELAGKVEGGRRIFDGSTPYKYRLHPDDDNSWHYTTIVEWQLPRSVRGKKMKFEVWCLVRDRREDWCIPNQYPTVKDKHYELLTWTSPPASESSVVLENPILSFDKANAGCFAIPYSFMTKKVNKATLYYTDVETKQVYSKPLTTKMGDMCYVPADRRWTDVHIEASVTDYEDKADTITSNRLTTKLMHFPRRMKTKLLSTGSALLTWEVDYEKEEDSEDTDFFEIHRHVDYTDSTKHNDPGWVPISSEILFVKGQKTYTFEDNTLLDRYKGRHVAYRVRRSSTTLWNWGTNSGYSFSKVAPTLTLPWIERATVQRIANTPDSLHQVRLNFTMGAQKDEKGRFIIRNQEDWQKVKNDETYTKKYFANAVMTISDADDYLDFVSRVNNENAIALNAVLLDNVEVIGQNAFVGFVNHPYCGEFDGLGYMLTIETPHSTNLKVAPFRVVGNGATIKNLVMAGKMTSDNMYLGGLIGEVDDDAQVNIEGCMVMNTLVCTVMNNQGRCGGIVGLVGQEAKVNIVQTAFNGVLISDNASGNGGFVGWADQEAEVSLKNCLFNPQLLPSKLDDCKTFVHAGSAVTVKLDSCYYTKPYEPASALSGKEIYIHPDSLKTALDGRFWYLKDGLVYPRITPHYDKAYYITVWDYRAKMELHVNMSGQDKSTVRVVDLSGNEDVLKNHSYDYILDRKCVEYDFKVKLGRGSSPLYIGGVTTDSASFIVEKVDTGSQRSYKYLSLNKITKFTAKTKQSSVLLQWETSGGESDYFRVLRREIAPNPSDWKQIATNLVQHYYEDDKLMAQHSYDYKVESVLQCEGIYTSSDSLRDAKCEPTGKVSGYVRMADGTAMSGIKVVCTPDSNIIGAEKEYTTYTNDVGFFEFSKLPFQRNGSYNITIKVGSGGMTFRGPNAYGTVYFSENQNWQQEFNFYMDTYYIYAGNVYYRDTSMPVADVSFLLDGKPMYDASKKLITTNTEGAFSLSIPRGEHSVQAVKDGHYFAADGFLINQHGEDPKKYNFTENISEAVVWDSTTVVLRGRVVGGNDQGMKALGESLSKNNLGDSLKIVMQLEGDNTSYLFRKQDDLTQTSNSYKQAFGHDNQDTTRVKVTRHTLTIYPDAKTGEYYVKICPAKYKVIEISAQGYATLFQEGKVGETIDLTFNVRGDTVDYNRIYHAVPTMKVTQFNPTGEPFLGSKYVSAVDNIGNNAEMSTWYWKKLSDTDSIGVYAFGYPVFMANSPYGWMLQACEKYYYNNLTYSIPDIVNLEGGKVVIKNRMVSDTDTQELELDSIGGASYIFTPANTSFVMAGENALKNVGITLEYDNNFYDIKPIDGEVIKGYVMATVPKPEGRKSMSAGLPILIDVLRDPPGASSSAYLEEGSTLSMSYNAQLKVAFGGSVTVTKGNENSWYDGYIFIPPSAEDNSLVTTGDSWGDINMSDKKTAINFESTTYYDRTWTYTYNLTTTQKIETSSSPKWVGGKADVFIGTTPVTILGEAIAVRVIPDSIYQIYKNNEGGSFNVKDNEGNAHTFKVKTGAMVVLGRGVDATGDSIYLVRNEVTTVGSTLASSFAHSQHYIENELIPELIKFRNSLILAKGTTRDYAMALAKQQNAPVYVSKVDNDDVNFGFNDTYDVYLPSEGLRTDTISHLNNTILTWLGFLVNNEKEKVTAYEANKVKRYDFDGASKIAYSEAFSMTQFNKSSWHYPLINDVSQITSNVNSAVKAFVEAAKNWNLINLDKAASADPEHKLEKEKLADFKKIVAGGYSVQMTLTPKVSLNYDDYFTQQKTNTKKIGFTMGLSGKSSLTVDVYRTATEYQLNTDTEFGKLTKEVLDKLRRGNLNAPNYITYAGRTETVYSSFVYRTRGGVTAEPYEPGRTTKWYQPGYVLDAATVPIDRPKIWIDEPTVSNVPYDEPARFVLHMANESDYPDRASLKFNYYLKPTSNPHGAKVFVDGTPLNSQGVDIILYPCRTPENEVSVFTKEIEVYAGNEYDYNDLVICLYDPNDANLVYECKLSAHFVPTAGKLNITAPSNKWVMNTESPYDGKRQQWYMPVVIDGFDVNYRNFDHIELQYKLSTQGEKDWVSVCSYYADKELMKKASGITDTIPENGKIIASFYGETDPVEQYYDIRAVNYCRHGNGFLTRSSEVLTGIKDTRLPVPFGTPEPVNGILGVGDDIIIKFSEPIAGNYLRNINNFEVVGNIRSNDITTSTTLYFNGNSSAISNSKRNLTGKNFAVDVLLNPATDKREMTVFAHGGVAFGLTADRRLKAVVNGVEVVSDSVVKFNGTLQHVGYALEHGTDSMTIHFYSDKDTDSKKIAGKYEGVSYFVLGSNIEYDEQKAYNGEMLECRLWNRTLKDNLFRTYGYKKLMGTEAGLLDYYPLNEGEGMLANDKATGSIDMTLLGTSWKLPSGISMKLDGEKGIVMSGNKFMRNADSDYTLMFWFSTNKANGTLFANGEAKKKDSDQLNIGLKNGLLYVRSAGFEKNTEVTVCDGSWHHFAMTVCRSQKVANIYVDKKLVESLNADSLKGFVGDHVALGVTYVDKSTPTNQLTGNIDEVGFFSSVLPQDIIKYYANHTPIATTSSMLAYLSFEKSQKMDNNLMSLDPTGVSIKRYMDNQGKILNRQDTLVNDVALLKSLADRQTYAPIASSANLKNVNYNFVSNDNQLYISINEPDYMIEKSNIYVTAMEIPDLQGNRMASPITLNYYVYRNPLRWDVKKIDCEINYGYGGTFEATVKNLSGVEQNFTIEDLPRWLTASQTQGTVSALSEQTITFTISDYINIGAYDEQITLVGNNYMSEALPVKVRVRGNQPDWAVSEELMQTGLTMMMVARVKINQVVASSTEDILAAFDKNQQTVGVAHVERNDKALANEALVFLTIYGSNSNVKDSALTFRFYNAAIGRIYSVKPADGAVYRFTKDAVIGSADKPVELVNTATDVQTLNLKKGWNWMSIGVNPEEGTSVGRFFNNMSQWEVGDKIMAVDGTKTVQYTYREKSVKVGTKTVKVAQWDNEDSKVNIKPETMYNIYSMSDKIVYLEGKQAYEAITVGHGWNRIGYLSTINLPIEQALSDYTDQAQEGDLVKSQDGFSIASRTVSGLVWKGTLRAMEIGKGYMLNRKATDQVSFYYPYYDESQYTNNESRKMNLYEVNTLSTMNIVAAVEGVTTEAGDQLVAYCGTDRMGVATADSEQNYYLNVGTDSHQGEKIAFVIERDGEAIATANSSLSFEPNRLIGTPAEPTVINFLSFDDIPNDGKWYTTAGIMLSKKPTCPGLYIRNGKVQMVK